MGTVTKVDCEYCSEFLGGTDNAFSRIYGPFESRTILDTGTVRVFPTLGQLVEGHLLIAPMEHYPSFADLDPQTMEEVIGITDRVRTVLEHHYGACVLFEHGARGANPGGCGIYHAHLHAVPFATDEPIAYLKGHHTYYQVSSLMELGQRVKGSYLYFENNKRERFVFEATCLPSQYLRRILADSIGKANWDWRSCGREQELRSTIVRLAPELSAEAVA